MQFQKKTKVAFQAALLGSALAICTVSAWAAPVRPAAQPTAPVAPRANDSSAPRRVEVVKPIPPGVTVAATVNNDKVMMSDVDLVIDGIKKQRPSIDDATLDRMRRDIVDDMIVERLLIQEAYKRKLMPDKSKVDDMIWNYKKKFPTEAEYQKAISTDGHSEADLRRIFSEEAGVRALSKQLVSDVTVSDDEVTKFYNDNKEEFVVPESVHISQIQVSVKPDTSDGDKTKLRKKADDLLKKAKDASPQEFAALAASDSDDIVSAQQGGDMGFITKDDVLDDVFMKAVFSGDAGKVLPKLVTTKFGFHIIRIEEKKPAHTMELDEVKDRIKFVLLQQRMKERMDARVADMRKAATIKMNI